jgi:hypothetical protein
MVIEKQLHYEEDAEQVRNHDHIEKNISNSKQDIEQCDQVNMTPFKEVCCCHNHTFSFSLIIKFDEFVSANYFYFLFSMILNFVFAL